MDEAWLRPSKRARSSQVSSQETQSQVEVGTEAIDADAAETSSDCILGSATCDLACFIDGRKTCCANEDPSHPHTNVLVGVPRAPSAPRHAMLVSQCDPQLLLEIGFTGAVNLQQLRLRSPGDGRAPRNLRVFANAPHLDFDSAESQTPTQFFDLQEHWRADDEQKDAQVGDVVCDLKLSIPRFQRVNVLTLFVEDNIGDTEETALMHLSIIGTRVHKVIVVGGVL